MSLKWSLKVYFFFVTHQLSYFYTNVINENGWHNNATNSSQYGYGHPIVGPIYITATVYFILQCNIWISVHGNWMNPCHIVVPRFTLEGVIFMDPCPYERVSYLCTLVHIRWCNIFVPRFTLEGVIFMYPCAHERVPYLCTPFHMRESNCSPFCYCGVTCLL